MAQTFKKVILVTGSSRGIGAALAENFIRMNFLVIINYCRSRDQAVQLESSLNAQYGNDSVMAIPADVSRREEVVRMFDHIYREFGRLDVLINNAGINRDAPFLEMSDENWWEVISTILGGTFLCSQEFARRYRGEGGHIINIGALTAIRGRANGVNYCSARAGVVALNKCLALELAPRIRVNCVTPGWINTSEVRERYQLEKPENLERAIHSTPLRRLGTPEDVVRLIDFLVTESSYITGQNYLVDGGMLMY